MARRKKDGQFLNIYLDKTLYQRLCHYADERGQTKTRAIELILKRCFDENGIPEPVHAPDEGTEG